MRIVQRELRIRTQGKGFSNITNALKELVAASNVRVGTCNVFIRHTSSSLLIQENADPRVLGDLSRWFAELAPESRPWEHDDEGPDDMPAHARSALTRTSETIPIVDGRLGLGTWQALYVWEHRAASHQRSLLVSIVGE